MLYQNILLTVAIIILIPVVMTYIVIRIGEGGLLINRYIVVRTSLEIYQAQKDDEDEEYSEEIRKLLGKEAENLPQRKIVSTQTVIDLEDIQTIEQWTSSKYEDEQILSDCTMIRFKSGDMVLAQEPFHVMEKVFMDYVSKKTIL